MNPNAVFLVTFALFFVWMGRHHRWTLLIRTMDGTLQLKPKP